MDSISTTTLFIILVILIIASGFFSSSETGMMTINRYRLRHLEKQNHRGAKRVSNLLKRPDRLIGIILIGNNFVNILASSIATIIAVRLMGDIGVAISTVILTIVILIFAELGPKTLAALHPERVAFPASILLKHLLTVLYPIVWLVNTIANSLLRLLGVNPEDAKNAEGISHEELRTIVHEAGSLISRRHQNMLLGILDLENVAVEDIMIPRNEIEGLNLDDDIKQLERQCLTSPYTRLVVYEDDIDQLIGILHVRDALSLIGKDNFSKASIKDACCEAYFIPEGTPLNVQLSKFQRKKERVGLMVNEYGDIQGLVTLEDILEEIVGEFTHDFDNISKDVKKVEDGYLVDGSANLRELNKLMKWHFPTRGPKTLSGLITEYLEKIPQSGTGLRLAGYPIEIVQVKDNIVKVAKIFPDLYRKPAKASRF